MSENLLKVYFIFMFLLIFSMWLYFAYDVLTSNNQFIEIEKTSNGFNTYKDGELQYEFTKQNTDSLSLETLKMIYEGE